MQSFVNHRTGFYLEQAKEDVSHRLPTPAPFLTPARTLSRPPSLPPNPMPAVHVAHCFRAPVLKQVSLASRIVGLKANLTEL